MVEYFKNALRGIGSVFVSNSFPVHAFDIADGAIISPLITDSNYINFLIDICSRNSITAIISLFDIDIYIIAVNRERFIVHGIIPIVSDSKVVEICNDKWLTMHFLKRHQFEYPKSYLSLRECELALNDHSVRFPLMLKPRFGMGSIGLFQADNELELKVFYNKIETIIRQTYAKHANFKCDPQTVIIEEKICGDEYGLDILNDFDGNFVGCVPKKKLQMRSGETDMAITVRSHQLEEFARYISNNLKHIGNLDVDLIRDQDGRFFALDLNARFGGQYPFAQIAGANYPLQIIKWLQGKPTDLNLLRYEKDIIGSKDIVPHVLTSCRSNHSSMQILEHLT